MAGGVEPKETRLRNSQVKIEILLNSLIFFDWLLDKRIILV